MFYGLNRILKNILPKRLFYRALLIVAVPVIILQLIITVVFFDSLWIKTNKGMTKALVNEINTFVEVYDDSIYEKDEITNLFSVYQDLNIVMIHGNKDKSVPVIYSRKILKIFKTTKKKLVIIKNGDHSLSSPKWLNILKKELKLIIN